jgi:hypothetical protein
MPTGAAHCPWTDKTMITFLVPGKFSSFDFQASRANPALENWHIPDRGDFYWAAHDDCWCNVYGAGTVSVDGVDHFQWQGTANPTETKVLAAANQLLDFCRRIKQSAPLANIRLVGHSAGANVCNFATHLMAGEFAIEQLILLSPPVYQPRQGGPHPHFPNHDPWAFPRLASLKTGRFFLFRPRTDVVLNLHRVWRTYDHNEIRNYPDANIAAVPGAQDEVVLPVQLGNNHWEPCDPAPWSRHDLWTKTGCNLDRECR